MEESWRWPSVALHTSHPSPTSCSTLRFNFLMMLTDDTKQKNIKLWDVGIFLLRFARKNLEETNAAVRIRNHVATSTISEKAVAFLFSAKFQLCEDVLQVELHNSFRLTSRFYPDSRRRLRLFFSIPTVCIVLFILFKTLFHLYPQGVKLS